MPQFDLMELHAKIAQLTLEKDFLQAAQQGAIVERKNMIDHDHDQPHTPSLATQQQPWERLPQRTTM